MLLFLYFGGRGRWDVVVFMSFYFFLGGVGGVWGGILLYLHFIFKGYECCCFYIRFHFLRGGGLRVLLFFVIFLVNLSTNIFQKVLLNTCSS